MPARDLDANVTELCEAIGLLLRRVRGMSAGDALSLTEAAVLKTLEKEGPMTSAQLARIHGMKPQSMGTTVAGLHRRGLVGRLADPGDGRRILLKLSAQGAALRQTNRDAKRAWLAQEIGALAGADQAALFAAGKIIRRICGT